MTESDGRLFPAIIAHGGLVDGDSGEMLGLRNHAIVRRKYDEWSPARVIL